MDYNERINQLEQNLQNVTARIERSRNRMKRAGWIAGGLLLLGLVSTIAGRGVHAPPPTNITASEFALLDNAGRRRATLSMHDGYPVLSFFDTNHTNILQIHAAPTGDKAMLLSDPSGKPRLMVGSDAQGSVGMTIYNSSNQPRIAVSSDSDDNANLRVFDSMKHQAGQLRVVVGAGSQGDSGLAVMDDIGRTRIAIGNNRDGTANIKINDASGVQSVVIPSEPTR